MWGGRGVPGLERPPAPLLLHHGPEVVMKQQGVVYVIVSVVCVQCVRVRVHVSV